MRHSLNTNRRLFTLALTAAVLCFGALTAHAVPDNPLVPPPAAPPVAAAPQNSTPAPQTPAPTVPPATAPAARREETEVEAPAPTQPAATGPGKPNLFQKAAAYLQGREAIAADLMQRDRTIADLRAQVAERDQTIANQNSELAELRAGRDQLQTAVNSLEGQRRNVTETVAALGFPSAQLPATGNSQHAVGSADALREQLKATSDPKEKHRLSQEIRALENPAKTNGAHGAN